jgi:transposase-like protein
MAIEMTCPTCGSHDISKNGMTRRGKQNHKCYDCGRQFVEDPQWQPKAKDTFGLVNLLLLEKIPLAGIARAAQVSNSWLQKKLENHIAAIWMFIHEYNRLVREELSKREGPAFSSVLY